MPEKITKRTIDALRDEAVKQQRTRYLFDSEYTGFGALSTKEGKCSYFVQYRLGGVSKRMTIGKHGALTPDEARKRAKEELGKVARNVDVAQERKDARAKLKAGLTLRDLIERYLSLHAKPTRYWKEKRARLLSDDLKALHGKPAAIIKRGEIAAAIDKVQPRSHAAALLLFSDIRPIFAWALNREALDINPMVGMKGPELLKVRDRVLSDAEIKALWQVATEQSWPFENVIKLLLLTGQRKSEVAGMRWSEVDLDACSWTIAKERCKNGKAHTIDLHLEAVALLDRLGEPAAARRAGDEEFVFSTTGRTPVAAFSDAKRRIDARMQTILGDKFQPWRIHDLRRTAASGMAALGFQPHIIERVLNHISGAQGGLVSVYQRHEYRDERKRAIMAWGDHVVRLVKAETPASNIVPLRRGECA
jgi:integrase